jgi:hypothetical protein
MNFREIGAALVALADANVDTLALARVADLAGAIIDKVDDLSPDTPVEDIRAIIDLAETLELALDRLALAVAPIPIAISTVVASVVT